MTGRSHSFFCHGLLALLIVLFAAAPDVFAQEAPANPTEGVPTAAAEEPGTIFTMIEDSGPSGWAFIGILALFSIVAAAISLERLLSLTQGRVIPPAFVDDFMKLTRRDETNADLFRDLSAGIRLTEKSLQALQESGMPEALAAKLKPLTYRVFSRKGLLDEVGKVFSSEELEQHRPKMLRFAESTPRYDAPIANILKAALVRVGRPITEVEKTMEDAMAREVALQRARIRPLNIIASGAPLVGLLGTVVGMILAFHSASEQGLGGRGEALAKGIYLALMTTAAGLTIAIPSLLFAAYFNTRIDRFMRETDEILMEAIPCLANMEVMGKGHSLPSVLPADDEKPHEEPEAEKRELATV